MDGALSITNRKSILPRQPSGPGDPKSGSGSLSVDVSAVELVELELELVSLADVPLDVSASVVEPSAVVPGSDGDVGPAPKLDSTEGLGLHAEARAVHSASGETWRMARLYPFCAGGGRLAPHPPRVVKTQAGLA